MSPGGVYHWGRFSTHFFRWEWVKSVEPGHIASPVLKLVIEEPEARPHEPEEGWPARHNLGRVRSGEHHIQVGALGVDPTTMYCAFCFYLRNPELRDELGTAKSVERIQAGDFPGLAEEVRRHSRILPAPPME